MHRFSTRASTLLALGVLALIPANAAEKGSTLATLQPVEVHAVALTAFDPRTPEKSVFGKLTFRGGLVLQSPNGDFGGLSALRVAADGEHFLSLSDQGDWLRGRIVYRDKVPVAIADAEMAPILGPDGSPLKRHGWWDAESLALDGNTAYVGIERVQQIVRFDLGKDGLAARGQAIAVPPGVKILPENQSLECIEVAPPGSALAGTLIAVSERGLDSHGNLMSFLIRDVSKANGAFSVFSLKRSDDFDVTDCMVAPGGRLMVLERRFSWQRGVAMRIRSVPLTAIQPGALVDGEELIVADMNFNIDNMEGLSVHRDADGALVLTLISDDNFSPLQRTLLLQFTMNEAK